MLSTGSAPTTPTEPCRRPAGITRTVASHTAPSMTASEIGHVVGNLEPDEARRHHIEMTAVVAELARDADMDWPWTHDDPTVGLLRALALLAMLAPDAVSARASTLCRRIEAEANGTDRTVPTRCGATP